MPTLPSPSVSPPGLRARRWERALAALLLAAAAAVLPDLALARARPFLLEIGPNDVEHVRGFRPDWERDGRTRFRWTTLSATATLPVRAEGDGHLLRMRVRRHFLDPAVVTVRAEGRPVTTFEIRADERTPYKLLELPLPPLEGKRPLALTFESRTVNPRPLGFALDWLEVERQSPAARFLPTTSIRVRLASLALAAFLAAVLAGASPRLASAHGSAAALLAGLGLLWSPAAAERILREGTSAYAVALLGPAALLGWWWRRRPAGDGGVLERNAPVALTLLLSAALALRLAILLHPEFYYPDVKVHALFAWQLARRGLIEFLREFTLNQYRYSLGLQFENGHWYAFPYPPAFYLLTWPLVAAAGYRPEVAVSLLAGVVNALELLLVFGLARSLRLSAPVGVAASAAHVVLPIFTARLSLAYFPALVGHAVDAVLLLVLVRRQADLGRVRTVAAVGSLLGLALLSYTQSLLNFGLILPLFLVVQVLADRTAEARRAQVGLLLAGALGLALAVGVFYGRYVPIFVDMQRGVAMSEERVLLEKQDADRTRAGPEPEEPPDDPYSGPTLDPIRGLKKAASRLWIFYSVFALPVLAGLALLLRRLRGGTARLVAVWAASYLLLNLASGGLPGPNLVRYNKDLEIVAPLFCLALALCGEWLWRRMPLLAAAYTMAYASFGALRAVRYLTEKFVLER